MTTKVKWKEGMHLDEYNRLVKEEEYEKWLSIMDRLLYNKAKSDVDDKGIYLDDEIGGGDYIDSIERVIGSTARTLYDCYEDNIDDIILEEIGSDSYN
jgi:hypothetical protein